jgi:proline iminopeptidase
MRRVAPKEYLVRTPRESVDLPDCRRFPPRGLDLYEYMFGPSEFIITGTLREFDRIDRLPELRLPVLFLGGEYDEARPETLVEFQQLVPGSVVKVIPEAGHIINVDQPEIFNQVVKEFLVEVESR